MGVATTIAIAAAASAAGSVASSKIQSNAAKKAASMQQQASNQGMDLQRQMYGQQMQMHSPYMGMGNSAANTLGRLMGAPAGAQFASAPLQNPMMGMGMPMGGMGYGQPQGMAMRRPPPMSVGPPQMGGQPQGGRLADLAMMR
jgi:hypothetical protein